MTDARPTARPEEWTSHEDVKGQMMTMWPDGYSFGATVSFDFDAEEVWIGEDPENESRPGVLSQGAYSPKVAIPLILAMLGRQGITSTFYVPGRDALRHPGRVREILAAGHEVGHHGHSHQSPTLQSRDEEAAEMRDGLAALQGLGADVVGYRSPSWDFSPNTLDLLEEHGFAYSSNLMDDIRPYRHEGRPLVEVPVSWMLDDAPHFWFASDTWQKTIRSAAEVEALWLEEIEGIAALGGHVMLTTHPQFIGRPGRLLMLERVIERMREMGAWIAPTRDVADRVVA